MFRNIILSAAAAGLAVGLATTALQAVTTTPLILKAEVYEKQEAAAHAQVPHTHAAQSTTPTSPAISTPAAHHHDSAEAEEDEGWAPADGLERTLYTSLANILVAVAIASVLLGFMVLRREKVDARRGLVWGVAGFAAASLLPSMGLPPELPGTEAADIIARQAWWLATIAASAAGLALLVLSPHPIRKIAGAVLLVLPHVFGAPEPPTLVAAYPAGMASEFASLSLAVSAFVWTLSGAAAGWLFMRLSATDAVSEDERSVRAV